MRFTLRFAFSLAIAVLALGCQRSSQTTPYDAVASILLEDSNTFALATTTDSRWFRETTVESVIAEGTVSHGRHPPWLEEQHVPLLKRLFEVNSGDGALEWPQPDPRIRLMEGSYRAKPRDQEEVQEMCFSSEAGASIGVYSDETERLAFRPYYSFSKAAFSNDGQFAMLKVAYACAPLSGAHESIVILKMVDGAWVLHGATRLWVS